MPLPDVFTPATLAKFDSLAAKVQLLAEQKTGEETVYHDLLAQLDRLRALPAQLAALEADVQAEATDFARMVLADVSAAVPPPGPPLA